MKQNSIIAQGAQPERAILVGLITPTQDEAKSTEYLDELAFLADTAGAEAVKRFTQRLDYPNPRTFVGKGKLEEIKQYIEDDGDIAMAIFDDDLSTKQVLNIERELGVKILDRTNLILDIFAKRAQTASAKTQVELAQYQYLLPRLTRMWTHLERQRGGIGMRGPGNTDRDRPPYNPHQNIAAQRRAQGHRPPESRAAQEPRQAHARGTCRLYQCRQVYNHESAEQERCIC